MKKSTSASHLIKVNLGSGPRPQKGYINIDIRAEMKPDKVCDVTKGLPFEDSSVDEVLADDFLEHIPTEKVPFVMSEIHRVLRPDGFLVASVPSTDSRGAFMDPTHRSYWNFNSWFYYTNPEWHALYPELPFFRPIVLRDVITSPKHEYDIIHTKVKVQPVKDA